MPTVGSLFSGVGGLDLGLERAGWEPRWQVEIDPYCQKVLEKHWPDVNRWGDVREFAAFLDGEKRRRGEDDSYAVDLIAGGFPCQPVSFAGRGLAQADERWLWPEFARVVRVLRPRYVFVENVPGLLARGMGDVLGDLAGLGYDAEWESIPAAAVGAPHLRYRVWIVAYRQADAPRSDAHGLGPHREEVHQLGGAELRDEQERQPGSLGAGVADPLGVPRGSRRPRDAAEGSGGRDAGRSPVSANVANPNGAGREEQRRSLSGSEVAHADRRRPRGIFGRGPEGERLLREFAGSGWWASEPDVGRVANGVPYRVDRLRGLGNAVVPQVAEWIGRRILEWEAA